MKPVAEAEDKDASEQPFILFTFLLLSVFLLFFIFTKYISLLRAFDVCLVWSAQI